ncbi:hypothetical protein [Nitrosomonas sp. Nm84]|uniref:hypothetical protein n=1 Tax=Nitrosomonas sp. Nm84 TaxID=200124 RepID=UPI0021AC1E91|nr:hypothetical protein [Nitrosomonas sp. Nm84]
MRFDRLTPREKDYLRALAELGAEPQRSGDVAAVFTVPLFDTFMKRAMPQLPAKGGKA